jgi:hypothetical protein
MSKKRIRTGNRRQRAKWFVIYGHKPNADEILCGHARSTSELGQRITQLFEQHPEIIYAEVLFFRTLATTDREIREAIEHKSPPSS